jgi:predicted lipoprotein with Yx(FWY)xxD motif
MRIHPSPIHGARRRGVAIASVAIALGLGALIAPAVSGASVARHSTSHAKGVEISMANEAFGAQLIVGNGPLKGFSVYAITSDSKTHYGCTTVVIHFPGGGGPGTCTGPETSQSSEWPALTTTAAPVAGPGITKSMLSSVYRKGVGHQVVYDGHPLYLFDQGPDNITGEGFDEPSLPPWHGTWWLVNPSGSFQEWNQTLTANKLANGTTVLEAIMNTGGGFHFLPLYFSSTDTSNSSSCGIPCSRVFEPLLTTGTPGVEGTLSGSIGSFTRTDGTTQVTYNGRPLYLYSDEGIVKVPGRGGTASGSGNGKIVGSGTFHLVTP